MRPPAVAICGVGMVSPVGTDVISSCAAIRAQVCGFREVEDIHYLRGEHERDERTPVIMAPVFRVRPADPVADLLLEALRDLAGGAGLRRSQSSPLRLRVCLPPWAPAARPGPERERFLQSLAQRAGVTTIEAVAAPAEDSAGMLAAVVEAAEQIAQAGPRVAEPCLVAGVGSYFDPKTLAELEALGRLKSATNRDGFIPGECGVVLLLEAVEVARERGVRPLAILRGWGRDMEPRSLASGEISSGQGLARAIKQAFASVEATTGVTWVACDLNGESYRASEWGLVQASLPALVGTVRATWHPADCIGDVGGASGGVLLATVARAFARGYHPAQRALVWTGSDRGARSAVIVDKPDAERN